MFLSILSWFVLEYVCLAFFYYSGYNLYTIHHNVLDSTSNVCPSQTDRLCGQNVLTRAGHGDVLIRAGHGDVLIWGRFDLGLGTFCPGEIFVLGTF